MKNDNELEITAAIGNKSCQHDRNYVFVIGPKVNFALVYRAWFQWDIQDLVKAIWKVMVVFMEGYKLALPG